MIKETTGKTIKYLRTRNGLNKQSFCDVINLGGYSLTNNIARLEKVERDELRLSEDIIEKIAYLFDVNVESILGNNIWITTKKAQEITGIPQEKINYHAKNNNLERKSKNGITGRGGIYLYRKQDLLNLKEKISMNRKINCDYKNKPTDKYYFLERINELVNQKEFSPNEIANRIGINSSTFHNYLNDNLGFNFPSEQNMNLICEYFDVDFIFFRKWVTGEEAAKIAGCSIPTIYNRYKDGEVERIETGDNIYYLKDDVKRITIGVNKNRDSRRLVPGLKKDYFAKKLSSLIPDSADINFLAEKIGISHSSLHRYIDLNIDRIPYYKNFKKICDYFNVSSDYFIENNKSAGEIIEKNEIIKLKKRLEKQISELREITRNQSNQIKNLNIEINKIKNKKDMSFFDKVMFLIGGGDNEN